MSNNKKTILFISHEASNTGAPILLLNLIKIIKQHGEFNINILLVKNGQLRKEFATLGRCGYIKSEDYRAEKSTLKRIINKLLLLARTILNIRLWTSADIVFNNTVWSGQSLMVYSNFKKLPVISYIHELVKSIRPLENNVEAKLTFELSDYFLAASNYNLDILSKTYNIPAKKFKVLNYFVGDTVAENSTPDSEKDIARKLLSTNLGISSTGLWILGMGTFDLRKGADYFIKTANELKDTNIHFFWIGTPKDVQLKQEMERYIRDNDIANFHYLGAFPHSMGNYLPYDILYLSSREDPYPMVVLEAAAMKMPTLCFNGSGGITDFVEEDCGWIVGNEDYLQAAKDISRLSLPEIKEKGINAYNKVRKKHMDPTAIYNAFVTSINLTSQN